jgi:hypothetical protein
VLGHQVRQRLLVVEGGQLLELELRQQRLRFGTVRAVGVLGDELPEDRAGALLLRRVEAQRLEQRARRRRLRAVRELRQEALVADDGVDLLG